MSNRPDTTKRFLRYEFTEEELRQKANELAQSIQRKTGAEEQKKAATAQFKERIDGENAIIGQLSRHINNRFEMRDIECRVEYNTPNTGFKRISRIDSGELVAETQMSPEELQDTLFKDPPPTQTVEEREGIPEAEVSERLKDLFERSKKEQGDLTTWMIESISGGPIVVAAHTIEDAQAFGTLKFPKFTAPDAVWTWCDPDLYKFTANPDVYQDDERTARRAIQVLVSLNEDFPCLLDHPPMEEMYKASQAAAEAPQDAQEPAQGDGKPSGEDLDRVAEDEAAKDATAGDKGTGKRGRPKGSKNKQKPEGEGGEPAPAA